MKPNYSEIARQAGISVSHVSRVLKMERKPSLRILLLLAKTMGLSPESLIKKIRLKGTRAAK